MELRKYTLGDYRVGASLWRQALWYFVGHPLLSCRLIPSSRFKCFILRLFGARVGRGVRIKPLVSVKFPWRLEVGDYSWIGERVWIDNLAEVTIGANCCISQGAYFCTGSHNWAKDTFDLITRPIKLEDHVWIAAYSTVAPGVTAFEGAVLVMRSAAMKDLDAWSIYRGNPAELIGKRPGRDSHGERDARE